MISNYKFIDITVEGGINIATFDITTGILNQSIRIKYVISNLTSKRIIHLFTLKFR